jgi:alkylhydroperoxidase family enzyme
MDESARVPLRVPGEVEPAVQTVFDEFIRERGKVPNLFRAAAHRPEIVATLRAHMNAVMGKGEVPVLLKELLAVRVSHINLCDY